MKERTNIPSILLYHVPLVMYTLFLFISVSKAYCADGDSDKNTSLLLAVVASDEEKDSEFEALLTESLKLEFERSGISVSFLAEIPALEDTAGRQKVMDAARERNFGFAGTVVYTAGTENIIIELACFAVEDPDVSAEISRTADFDLSLDRLFREIVTGTVALLKPQLPDAFFISKPRPPGPVPEKAEPEYPVRETEQHVSGPEIEKAARFNVSLGAAPFLTLGKTNYFFTIGMLSSVRGNYLLRSSFGDFRLGFFSGLLYFKAAGLITSSDNFLVPAGIDVQYGTSVTNTWSFFLRLSGGITCFIFVPEGSDPLNKLVPYASAATGFTYRFRRLVSLSFDAGYFVFFESYYPIMGIVPSIYLNFRF